jgi:hypothetical protein
LADEHKTVLLSIIATVLAAILVLIITIGIAGGISISLIKGYVVPLFMSAFTLSIFWGFLFARQKGKLPFLTESEAQKEDKPAPASSNA